jgi:hypothetical protein
VGANTTQAQGPLLRITWALDCHASVALPALTFLTPDGLLHFGTKSLVLVAQGRDPRRLPRYMLETPHELVPQHRPALLQQLQARLEWYAGSGGDELRLLSVGAGGVRAEDGGVEKLGVTKLQEDGGGVLSVERHGEGERMDGASCCQHETVGEEGGQGRELSAGGGRTVCVQLKQGREKPIAPRRQVREEETREDRDEIGIKGGIVERGGLVRVASSEQTRENRRVLGFGMGTGV